MKRLSFVFAVIACTSGAFAAVRPSSQPVQQPTARASRASVARTQPTAINTGQNVNTGTRAVTARSATNAPTAPVSTTQNARSARAATPQTTTARAAKQSVISTGTKVVSATENTAVDPVCWEKFSGCMDSFCMLDNANGGRCICSDKNAEYDEILEEIKKLDEQSYQLATVGVERIEMGDAVDAVMSKTDSVTKRVTADAAKSKRQSLDLSSWNSLDLDFDVDAEDIFGLSSDGISIENKKGDALYRTAAKLCVAQIPDCNKQSTLMELMYKQRIRSDCTAYENSLRASRTQSAQKLAAAQSAMREAALEQYHNANKYDLGQCTIEFKKCMQTTGGCGDDFTGCVDLAARANSAIGVGGASVKQKTIKGTSSKIQIAAATYDTLEAKKPLCMTVTQQCVNVRDQVWDAFLREAAPQVKAAELIVESNLRTSCITNISNCFQKACRDTMDPNDPEGSYDMCLTRPDTLRSLCKVEIDPCESAEPQIMEYVRARLKSMRVDSCTKEFKECLQSEDRCGEDYTQCIGLDTDTIVRLCPAEKLTGCTYEYSGNDKKAVKSEQEIYTELATIAQGIFLSIDNNMLTACQRAADAAMIKVCGSTENCDDLVVDSDAGTRSFKYQVCQYNGFQTDSGDNSGNGGGNRPGNNNPGRGKSTNQNTDNGMISADTGGGKMPKWTGLCYDSLDAIAETELRQTEPKGWAGKLSGLVYWGNISFSEKKVDTGTSAETGRHYEQTRIAFTTEDEYLDKLEKLGYILNDDEKQIIHDRVFGIEMSALTSAVENAIDAIESDPTVQYCMNGRAFQGMRMNGKNAKADGKLTYLGSVDKNGEIDKSLARFPNLTSQMRQVIAISALKNARDNYMVKYDEEIQRMMKDQVKAAQRLNDAHARDIARKQCSDWANSSELPVSEAPKASNAGAIIAIAAIVVAAALVSIFTWGAGAPVAIGGATIAIGTIIGGGVALVGAGAAATVAIEGMEPVGHAEVNNWNFKQTITTMFNEATGECTKETISQDCAEVKKNYCKDWADPVETVTSINLLE